MNVTDSNYIEFDDTKEIHQWTYSVIGVYLLVTGIFGTFGNIIAIIMFYSEKSFRTSIDLLLMNLAAADVAMTVGCFPFVTSSSFAGRWLFGNIGCQLYGLLGYLFGCTALLSSCAISVERYLVICRKYPVRRKNVFMMKVVACTWIMSLVWAVIPFITGTNYSLEPFKTSCTINWYSHHIKDRIYIGCMVSMVFACVLVMCLCYIKIYSISKKESVISLRAKRDQTLAKVCFALVVVFVVCWIPYALFSSWYTFGTPTGVPLWVTVLPVMMAKLSCCINPFLYLAVSKRFRDRYLSVLQCSGRNRIIPGEIDLSTINGM